MALQKIHTISLFKNQLVGTQGTGGTGISNIIDVRDIAAVGNFSLSYNIVATNGTVGAGSAGSTVWEYLECSVYDGSYVAAGTFGTFGAVLPSGIIAFTPILAPFIKVKVVSGTSNPAVVNAELNIR
jgi:hypothetical protein